MIVILGYMDGRALRAWRMPIEPNSLVAVFTTLAKTALMIPVASAISQMKWLWFERPRRLADLAGEVDRLRAAGVPLQGSVVSGPGGRQVLVADPDGNLVELFEPVQ